MVVERIELGEELPRGAAYRSRKGNNVVEVSHAPAFRSLPRKLAICTFCSVPVVMSDKLQGCGVSTRHTPRRPLLRVKGCIPVAGDDDSRSLGAGCGMNA
eukprot:1605607-Rhodomonas_salina.5